MDVRMPDGTIITGVPDNITQTELLARYNKFSTTPPAATPITPTAPVEQEQGLPSIAKSAQESTPVANRAPNVLDAEEYKAAVEKRKQESPERTISGTALDAGITLLKGTIGLPEAFVGLADIPTRGALGKFLEQNGYKPKEANEILDTYLSEAQQAANRKVKEAKGFTGTIQAALENPGTIATAIGESLPQLIGGAGIARGILTAAPKVGAVVAGGLGEGILGAGSAAEDIRAQNANKLLTTQQSLAALGSGAGTALFGVAGGRLAQKLGLDDVQTMLAAGTSLGPAKSVMDFSRRAVGSGISEGVFQEMPQSGQEKMWMNYATDRPLMEGVSEAMGMGVVTGFGMGLLGGGAGASGQQLQGLQQLNQQNQQILGTPPAGTPPAGTPPTAPPSAPVVLPVPPSDSPVVSTTTVNDGGKESIKTTHRDGSVDIDGVQVLPPTETAPPAEIQAPSTAIVEQTIPEGGESQDLEAMLAELEAQMEGKPEKVKAAEVEQVPTGGPSAPIEITTPETPAAPIAPTGGPSTPAKQTPEKFDPTGWTQSENTINKKTGQPRFSEGVERFTKQDENGNDLRVLTKNGEVRQSTTISPTITLTNSSFGDENESVTGRIEVNNLTGKLVFINDSTSYVAKMGPRAEQQHKDGVPFNKIAETEFSDSGGILPDGTRTPHTTTSSIEKPAPVKTQKPTAPVAAPAVDLMTEAYKYNTPDLRLEQSDAFGMDVTTALYQETESYGRAALKNRSLTDGYAKKKDAIVDAADAATIAFGTGDYSVFAPYAQTFPKVAKKLQAHLTTETKAEPVAEQAAPVSLAPVNNQQAVGSKIWANGIDIDNFVDPATNELFTDHDYFAGNTQRYGNPADIVYIRSLADAQKATAEGKSIFATEKKEGVAAADAAIKAAPATSDDRKAVFNAYTKFYTPKGPVGPDSATPEDTAQFSLERLINTATRANKPLVVFRTKGQIETRGVDQELPRGAKLIGTIQPDPSYKYKTNAQSKEGNAQAKAAKPKTNLDKVAHLRKLAWEKNPLMAFLADKGLFYKKGERDNSMSEFNGGKQKMISGYGPVFKSSGLRIDALLPIAIQDGFVPQDATESDLYSLIQQAFFGKKIEALYQKQGQEELAKKFEERMAQDKDAFEERAGQTDAEWHGMSEADYVDMMAREIATVSDAEFAELDQAVAELDKTPAGNMSVRAAMEALGFTEQEIQDEERRTAAKTDEAVSGEPTQGNEESQAAPPLELETQTAEELRAKQAEIDRLTKENERLSKQAEAKAKADAERDEFVLTGSDRPADVAAAQGQQDIFGAAEEAPAEEQFTPLKGEDGKPVVVYRGSLGEEKDTFAPTNFFSSGFFGKGINLTSSPEDASKYASTDAEVNIDLPGRASIMADALGIDYNEAKAELTKGGGKVYPLLVSMNNPLVIGKQKLTVPEKVLRLALAESNFNGSDADIDRFVRQFNKAEDGIAQFNVVANNKATTVYRQIASLQNKDGLIIEPEVAPKGKGATHYLVFDKEQVKSVFEVADEVVGPAEKPAAPQLTREPVTIEGEFTEIGEEQQRTLITDQTAKLSDTQLGSLEKFYGFARDTEEFADAVRQDVVNFITKGATYVNGKIRAIIRSMANGVLSVAVAFNPQFVSRPYTIAVPQFETRIEQVMQEVPAEVQGQMSDDAKRAYATIYPAIKGELAKNDKFFIVADKQTANMFVFNPDGSSFMASKTLMGAGIGDFIKGNNNIVSNRITPAGLFDLGLRDAKRSVDEAATAGEYDFGKVFVLDKSQKGANGFYSTTIMHSVWTKETDAKQRLAALQKPGAEDSRYSFGCINVDKATYGQLVENNLAQMDGAKIFIVPENGKDVMSFVNGKATYSTDIIRQRAEPVTKETKVEVQRVAPKAETERTVTAKEEEGPVFNSIEPTSNTFTRWTRGLPVVRMGEDHEFKSGEGVVVQSIHATTGDFDTFDRRKGNIESDLGAGFYSTNSTTDAAANYAGMGSDLTQKVERLAEQIADETDREYDDPEVVAEARSRYMANEGLSMPVFVRFENPVVLGGKGETFLDHNQEYNEETDEYGEPSGTLVDLAMAIREIGEDGSFEMDTEKAVDALMQDMDGMKASEAIDSLKKALVYAVDYDTGDVATNEIIRQAFERVGFDGFIDTTVNQKFGSEKRVGKSMAGMTPDTVHFIAFQQNQIKSSIGNRGTYDESGVITNDFSTKPVTAKEKKRSPSFRRRMDKLNRDRVKGKITDEQFVNEADWALKQAENARQEKPVAERVRGADFLRQKLLEAKRKGDLSEEAVDLAEWFIRNNENLVDDLGISVRSASASGVGGQYSTLIRIIILMKDAGSNLTVVHEILHHLERMMPPKVQQAIRTAWAKQLLSAQKKAKTPAEKLYFNALINAHYGNNNVGFLDVEDGEMSAVFMKALAEMDFEQPGNKSALKLAETLFKMGVVPYQNYQFFNPSEFWAVNGADIVQGRFDAVKGGVLARLKNWLKELGQKIKGLFGLDSKASIINALDSLAKGDGKFVTKEMLGEGEYKNISRNYEGNEAPAASWESPEESKMDNYFIYKLQDKLIDTKRVIQSIKKASGEIADNWDVYLKEELFHGRAAKRTQDFMNREMLPILEEMKDQGVTLDQFEKYLHMRHAEERNIQIAKVNPKMPGTSEDTSGSGISTERANKYLADLSAEQKKTFASLAKKFNKIIDSTQKLLVESGLEKQDTIDAWNGAYEHYVPLMRDDLDFKHHGKGVGAGYSTRGGSSKSAVGSTKKVIDIFANVALQRERAIVRAEKARVGRALYGLAIKNPNPGFWLPINPEAIKNKEKLIEELEALGLSTEDAENIIQEPKVPAIDKKTGLVKYQVNPLMRNSDNVFPVRINGEDRYIFFNTSDERAIRMVEALKNLDAEQLGVFLGSVATVTRWIASVNTQYNPVFGLWNFARDVQGAAFNLTTTDIAGHEKEVIDGVFPALKGIYTDLRQNRKKKTGDSEWAKLFEQYELAGGQTGYRDQFSQSEKRANIVKREMKKLNHGNVRKTAEAVFNWLSDYNDAMENAVRLSAFKVALDQGLSEERAASIAKNLTVNFNRKGAASPTLQSLYAFFNAAVQGTTRLVETLRGPSGKKIMAGGLAIGVAQAIALAMAGFDDEDPPEFLKNKNLIIPDFVTGSGNYLVIPMPLGFNIFPGIGRLTTEYVLGQAGLITGAKGAGDKMISMASLILDSFNPLGSGSILQMAAPTVVDPIVAIKTNRDAFGRPISKEDRATAPTPGYTRSRENASWFSKQLAEFLNYVSSPMGTKYTKGVISPTADQIDYLIGQYTGGVGREAVKTAQYGVAAAKGETGDLPSYKVPLLGKLYGETESPAAISSKFYENVTKLAEHENEIKMRIKNKDDIREYRAEHPETRFMNRVNNLENQITAINKQKKALQEREAPEERIKKLDERKTKLMKDFNDQIKRLERQ